MLAWSKRSKTAVRPVVNFAGSLRKATYDSTFLWIDFNMHVLFVFCPLSLAIFIICSCIITSTYGYGSIPINNIFSGMNIHWPAILMFTRGTRFWPIPIWPERMCSSADFIVAPYFGLLFIQILTLLMQRSWCTGCRFPETMPNICQHINIFHIAMGNGPFIDVYLLNMVIFHGHVK